MDMFGTKKRRAITAVHARLVPLIATVQQSSGIPPGFWRDDFVIGFVGTLIYLISKEASPRLSPTDLGFVLSDSFTAISSLNGAEIARQMTRLTLSPTVDFNFGADNATKCYLYLNGMLRNESEDKDILAAKRIAGNPEDRDYTSGALFFLLFHNVVRERFKYS